MALDKAVNCPACGFIAGDSFEECPKCGVVVKKYYQKQEERDRRVRTAKDEALQLKARHEKITSGVKGAVKGVKVGALFGIGIFSVGFVVCLIPVIGWVLGPFLMLTGIAAPFFIGAIGVKGGVDSAGSSGFRGTCPYCAGFVNVTVLALDEQKMVGADCPICKKRFVIRGSVFYPVPTSFSE